MLLENRVSRSLSYKNHEISVNGFYSPASTPVQRKHHEGSGLARSTQHVSPLPFGNDEAYDKMCQEQLQDHSGLSQELPNSKIFASTKTNVAPAFMEDERLLKSKVFLARYEKAAIVLQKHARRFLAHDALDKAVQSRAVRLIQAMARGFIGRKFVFNTLMAQRIQAIVRGWRARMHFQVTRLEGKLARIQQQHGQELAEIEVWKQEQKKLIDAEREKHAQEMQEGEIKLHHMKEAINTIQKDNKRYREQNEQIATAIVALLEENRQLEKSLKKLKKQIKNLKASVVEQQKQLPRLASVLKALSERKKSYETAIADRKEFIQFEKRCCHIFLNKTSEMVHHIQGECRQKALTDLITVFAMGKNDLARAKKDDPPKDQQAALQKKTKRKSKSAVQTHAE